MAIEAGSHATYAEAGVDIDAGNELIEGIRPIVRSTRRVGADSEIGGFGGLFDLAAVGYADPVLVATTDGVGTKLKIAVETGILNTVGVDLVAFAVGAVERNAILPRSDLRPGDRILGLASSGLHSTGFSLVRRLCAAA